MAALQRSTICSTIPAWCRSRPTGLGIAHGHDALQRGFYRALWSAPPGTATLGDLTLAGYRELFTRGSWCRDTLGTFALLDDPLTRARVQPLLRGWVPRVGPEV